MTHAPVRAALLGSGLFATNNYLPSLLSVPGLAVDTLWSRSEKSVASLAAAADKLGGLPNVSGAPHVEHGDDGLAKVLDDKDILAVILVLPIGVMPDLIRRCWKAGKHVISEKPLGRDVAEATALVEEYEKVWAPKGIVWRVAENYAHEPLLHEAAELLRSPSVGAVLLWRLHFETMLPDGASYHATTWRTVPDYQGGFLLDGGVHWAALLRTVLPPVAVPEALIAVKSLHRAHMLPHDTLVGVACPPDASEVAPHGSPTRVAALRTADDMPVQPGKSSPHGTFTLTWAIPDTPRNSRIPNELYVVTEHATLTVVSEARDWKITLTPGDGAKCEPKVIEGARSGIEVELADFADDIACRLAGTTSQKRNDGGPRGALWDLAFIEAALNSDGKKVAIGEELP